MKSLGGSVFVRNAIQYDYCIRESISSLFGACDEIVVLDCQSDDGTTEMLREYCHSFPRIKFVEGGDWECANNYERLKILANKAISMLNTDWHFMIQADEVLHESSHKLMRGLIEAANPKTNSFMCRRINFWGNIDNYLKFDLPQGRKPVSDEVIRLARRGVISAGDAESLDGNPCDCNHVDSINLFHYGFVRKSSIHVKKIIDMQSWFHGPDGQPDHRVVEMRDRDNKFDPSVMFNWDELLPLTMSHPNVAQAWADERRNEYPARP